MEGRNVYRALTLGAVGALVDFTVHGFVDQGYFLHMLALGFWFAALLIRVGYDAAFGEAQPVAAPAEATTHRAPSSSLSISGAQENPPKMLLDRSTYREA